MEDRNILAWNEALAAAPHIISHTLEPDNGGDCRVTRQAGRRSSNWRLWTDYRRGSCTCCAPVDHPPEDATRAAAHGPDGILLYWLQYHEGSEMEPCGQDEYLDNLRAATEAPDPPEAPIKP